MDDRMIKVLHYYGLLDEHPNEKFKIVCPFHEDDKPSLLVDLIKGNWYCFGCLKTGSAIDFVRYAESIDSLRATIHLSKIMKTSKVKNIRINMRAKVPSKELRISAKEFFDSLPKPSWKTIKSNYMFDREFTKKTLIEHNIKINQNEVYQIIAPVYDMGKFKGTVCRATCESDRKYLYNTGFSRRNCVVGDYFGPWVVVTEGYMDWLKLKQFGVKNASAILGWKATDEQIIKLQAQTDTIISALDNTESGMNGTKYLKQYFNVVRFKFPENCKDVGDMDIYDFRVSWNETMERVKRYEKRMGN